MKNEIKKDKIQKKDKKKKENSSVTVWWSCHFLILCYDKLLLCT